jgi:hypothetical protein
MSGDAKDIIEGAVQRLSRNPKMRREFGDVNGVRSPLAAEAYGAPQRKSTV